MMSKDNNELAWRVGGPQGSGVDTAAGIFARACAMGGLHIFGRREYYSNIKGRHSYYDVRVAPYPVICHRSLIDVLTTFEAEALARHTVSVVKKGGIIYDTDDADVPLDRITFLDQRAGDDLAAYLGERSLPPSTAGLLEDARQRGVNLFAVPFDEIIEILADELVPKSVASRALNTIAVAISCALLAYDPKYLTKGLEKTFPGRTKIIDLNVRAVELAYDFARKELDAQGFDLRLSPQETTEQRLLVGGGEAVAMGKIAAGMTFQTYYPISPATDESVYLEAHATVPQRSGEDGAIVVVQTEDELAALAMATGAALTGARSATATAGPGFSLMVEGLGWAGMNEVPLVVTLYQRGGPATGLATRTEQSDLLFAIRAGHGEFPRIVIASGDLTEAFYDAAQAFNYAERYQMPVIHLMDQTIARTTQTIPTYDVASIQIERGNVYVPPVAGDGAGPYPRFALTESGVSPRPLLGQPGGMHWLTGAEHIVHGLVTEDPAVREQQMEKRARKLEWAAREIPLEEKLEVYGHPEASFTIVGWGSNKGAILEALERLESEGILARLIQVRLLWPFPTEEIAPLVNGAAPLVVVESNFSGQMAHLLCGQTERMCHHLVVKYNGRPISCQELYVALRDIYDGKAEQRIVLRNPYE